MRSHPASSTEAAPRFDADNAEAVLSEHPREEAVDA
jgi:hypothetical protein